MLKPREFPPMNNEPESLAIFVRGLPAPQGSKRIITPKHGRPVMVEASKAARPWRQLLAGELGRAFGELRATDLAAPWDGPVDVRLVFHLLRPRTVKRQWPCVSPDVDKLVRSVLDALQLAGVVRDDAQVVRLVATKIYSDTPGVRVSVQPTVAGEAP